MTKIETEHTECVVDRALALVAACLSETLAPEERKGMWQAAGRLADRKNPAWPEGVAPLTCAQARERLARLNEKEEIRKKKGVYYTPADVVRFVVGNSVKGACGLLRPDGMGERQIDALPADRVCFQLSVFDPTCGAGEFLLGALELKLELLPPGTDKTDAARRVAATLHGNDINRDSVVIAKLRLFLCILERLGTGAAEAAVGPLNRGFTCRDYIQMSNCSNIGLLLSLQTGITHMVITINRLKPKSFCNFQCLQKRSLNFFTIRRTFLRL